MKLSIGVIFGGNSLEHELSILTAVQAMDNIDKERYEVVPIYITKDSYAEKWAKKHHFSYRYGTTGKE